MYLSCIQIITLPVKYTEVLSPLETIHAKKSVDGKGQLDEKSYKYNCKKIEEKLFTDKQKSEKRKKRCSNTIDRLERKKRLALGSPKIE